MKHTPFAIFRAPGFHEARAISPAKAEPFSGAFPPGSFFVGEFAKPVDEWLVFTGGNSPCSIAESDGACLRTTSRRQYVDSLEKLIPRLRARKGKTVISTVSVMPSAASVEDMIASAMASSPSDFCYAYSHPSLGTWIGATPELLLSCDLSTGEFRTMALAGTMAGETPWDAKNLNENKIVADFICAALAKGGAADIVAVGPKEVRYGTLRHLRTDISGRMRIADLAPILNALNPTPALCGSPRAEAMADISEFEQHRRRSYGGVVGYVSGNEFRAYVNIRCCMALDGSIAVYAGGGIMPDSIPEEEWAEAMAKRENIFNRLTSTENTINNE